MSGGLVFPSLEEFSTVYCDPQKGFDTVNKAEIDVFLELSCFFDDPADVNNLISGSSAFSKTSLNIWKFIIRILREEINDSGKKRISLMAIFLGFQSQGTDLDCFTS